MECELAQVGRQPCGVKSAIPARLQAPLNAFLMRLPAEVSMSSSSSGRSIAGLGGNMRRSGTLGASISANFPEIKYHWIKEGIIGGSEKESQVFHEIPTGRMVPCSYSVQGTSIATSIHRSRRRATSELGKPRRMMRSENGCAPPIHAPQHRPPVTH